MALPFLSTLSKAARTSWPHIRGGVRRGLPSRSIGAALRKHGFHVANETLLTLMRHERALIAHSADVRFINLNARPSISRMLDALTPIQRKFSYGVRVRAYLSDTTIPVERWVTIVSDRNLTRRQIQNAARNMIERASDRYGLDVVESQLTSALKRGTAGQL